MPVEERGADFPPELADAIPHMRHAPTHRGADRCVQVMGGTGLSTETIVEQAFRESLGPSF